MITAQTGIKDFNEAGGGKYYAGLDGLRGLAMILVLGYHNFSFLKIFDNAWLAVDQFFALSGFLITDILLRTKNNKDQMRIFYFRRVLRIFPIYYISLLLFFFFLPSLPVNEATATFYHHNKSWFWLYLQNWLYIFKTPDPSTFLNHFWSLAIEEQFYLLWPWMVLMISSSKTLLRLLVTVLVLVSVTRITLYFVALPQLNYYSFHTFTRIDGLITGSILAVYLNMRGQIPVKLIARILTALAFANVVFLFVNSVFRLELPYYPFAGYCTFAILFSLLIYLIISKQDRLAFFNFSWFRFIGKISYGLYLYHWPVFLITFPLLHSFLQNQIHLATGWSQLLAAIISTSIGILMGHLSFRFVETKFLRLKKYAAYERETKPLLKRRLPQQSPM